MQAWQLRFGYWVCRGEGRNVQDNGLSPGNANTLARRASRHSEMVWAKRAVCFVNVAE